MYLKKSLMLERISMVLKNDDLINIIGGGANKFTWGILISGLITLITGMIDGYFRPLKCNK